MYTLELRINECHLEHINATAKDNFIAFLSYATSDQRFVTLHGKSNSPTSHVLAILLSTFGLLSVLGPNENLQWQ